MRKLMAVGLAALFVFSIVLFGCGPSKELVAYHEAKVAKDDACDEYERFLDLNETYKDELDNEIGNLQKVKKNHEDIHEQRNMIEEKKGDPITPFLHGKDDPEAKLDWL